MILMLAGYFALVMGSVTLAGYLFLRTRLVEAAGHSNVISAHVTADPLLQSIQSILIPAGRLVARPGRGEESVRKQLFQAGYRAPSSYLVFHGIQVCLSLLAGATLGWIGGLLAAICGAGIGFMLPSRVLEIQVRARARRIRRAVPASLDLLVLAIEAGQSLDHAMRDTSNSLRSLYPDICAEFVFCHLEMSAGTSRAEALRRLGERSGDDELRKLASLLIDGERFGTSLGPALRTHAKYLRARMRSQAQETARKLGVKLVFPVFFLIFPSVLLVTLGPAYLQMRGFLDSFLQQ
ncbi:MAG: type II secretion system F family protein [Acidobacteriia bacterium]|nr:type II secretion system F family protein [Terriglobia bacterium]